MKTISVCYNIIRFLRSNILNLRNLIYFYFHKMLSNKFLGAKIHSLCKICLNEGSNALLLPCHHVSTCHSSTICIESGPISRCEIKSIIKGESLRGPNRGGSRHFCGRGGGKKGEDEITKVVLRNWIKPFSLLL